LPAKYSDPELNLIKEILLREVNVFIVSFIIGYILVRFLGNFLQNSSLAYAFFIKTLILVLAAFFMNFCIYFTYEWLIAGYSPETAADMFFYNMFQTKWLVQKMPEWIFLFLFTQLALEVNNKYSRGVFQNIILGKYLQPKEEKRIILFIDLRDSTPIAERLGHKEYFKFIRDFIYYISVGMIQHEGRVYQYVGDEIVAWWPESPKNARKCIAALIQARKELNKNSETFRRLYDIVPEYKAGVHSTQWCSNGRTGGAY
jgi:adenylate cyclase